MITDPIEAGAASAIVLLQTRKPRDARTLAELVPIASNAAWWRGFLLGVAAINPAGIERWPAAAAMVRRSA